MTPEEFSARSAALGHAIQTGVALEQQIDPSNGSPKHLRVGVNMALVEHAAIVKLLIAAGVFTEAQYFEAVITELEAEKARYTARLEAHYGGATKINLV